MFDRPRLFVLVAAIQALALASCAPFSDPTPDREGLARAVGRSIGAYRPTMLRLSVDLGYAPCPQAPCPELSGQDFEKLSRELSRVVRVTGTTPGSEASHTEALARLLVPRESYVEEALETLESLYREDPDNPEILNDLAVALGQLGLTSEARSLVRALDLARRAARRRPEWPTARFNVAVLETALHLPWAARTEWEEFLELDDSSQWSDEARERLRVLSETDGDTSFPEQLAESLDSDVTQLAASFPQPTSEHFLEAVLPGWAKAHLESTDGAEREWHQMKAFARALQDVQQDHLGADAITLQYQLLAKDPTTARRLAGAIVEFGKGRTSLRRLDLEAAEDHFELALEELDRAEHPLRFWCRIWLSLIHIYRGDHEAAALQLRTIEASVPSPERYPALMGRVHWHAGLSLTRQGHDAASLARFRSALPLFEALEFRESSGRIHHMMATDFVKLGQVAVAWRHRLEALRHLARLPRTVALHNALLATAETATDEGFTEVGEVILDQAIVLAEVRQRATSTTEAYLWRSNLHAKLDRRKQAETDLESAFEQAQSIPNSDLKERILSDLEFDRTRLVSHHTPSAALAALDSLLGFYRQRRLHGRVVDVHLSRARTLRASRRFQQAVTDLETAVELLIEKNWTLTDLRSRLTHNDVVQSLFEEIVALRSEDLRDPVAALAFAECGRLAPYGAVLTDLLGEGTPLRTCGGLDKALRERLDSDSGDSTTLVYMVLPNRVLIWRLADREIQWHTLEVSASDLADRTMAFAEAIRTKDTRDVASLGARLYEDLIQPILTADDAGRPLVIVPDRFLVSLPFATLSHPKTDRFLLQDHELVIAATAMASAPKRRESTQIRPSPRRILLVGDPAFDHEAITWLERLPGSQQEVETVARLYPEKTTLNEEAATREAIEAELRHAEIFHYAGHAVANRDDPLRSHLVLAASDNPVEAQLLRAEELLSLEIEDLRLVVLSGCETAGVGNRRGAGLTGLAMPFLLHGVEAVVASQWPIADDSTVFLMTAFHRWLTAGLEPAAALRKAQLEHLESVDPKLSAPASWAPFVTLEGF